ncbi:transferrin-binding protein-like solute binding protein, partial [Methylotenera sp.]|uniref:transferrin-binding protein-like solute binding protein n=1 Tax=Methylotenera sp. TaxID=2051956 RepID=UPI002735D44B
YTQFGDWYQCSANCLSGVSTEVGGFFVRGEVTSPANIPTTGSYTYNGHAYGAGIDAAGNAGSGTATMTATADFVTRSIAFATSNTIVQPFASGAPLAMPELDISGTLSYTAGQNRFTGPVNSGTGVTAMSGTATGQFHGAVAQEIGGVYSLTGAGGAQLGGFVGK